MRKRKKEQAKGKEYTQKTERQIKNGKEKLNHCRGEKKERGMGKGRKIKKNKRNM